MANEVGTAFVDIDAKFDSLNRSVHGQLKGLESSFGGTFRKIALTAGGLLAAVGVGRFLKDSVKEFQEAAKVGRITNAVIASTGGVANVTAAQIGKLADSLAAKSGVDDEVIQSGENVLATFTNVRNEVGKGNDIFTQGTVAALDMSAALGTDLQGSVIQLGKALNDPIKGITALSRVGVSFTQQQKDQIKTLVEAGDVLGAQKVILAELTKEFGGAAAAAADPLKQLQVIVGNFKEQIGAGLLPVISQIAPVLGGVLTELGPALGAALGGLVQGLQPLINALGPFLTTIGTALGSLLSGLTPVAAAIGEALASIAPELGAIGGTLAPVLAGFADLVPVAAKLFTTLAKSLRPVLPVIAKAIGRIATVIAELLSAGITALAPVFSAIVDAVIPLIPVFADLVDSLGGPLLDVIDALSPVLAELADTLGGALADAVKTLAPVLPDLAGTLGEVAVIVGGTLADALLALSPALPALAELTRIAAELIAQVPPDVLAAIVLGLLAFKGLESVSGGIGTFTTKLGGLADQVANVGVRADGSRTLLGKLIDKIGELASAAVQKIALKVGVESVSSEIGAGAAGQAGSAGLGAGLRKLFKDWGFTVLGTAGALVTSVGFLTALTITAVITGIVYSVANDSSPQNIKLPDFIGGNLLPTSKEVSDAIAGFFTDTFNTAWQAFWNDAPSLDMSVISDWVTGSFDDLSIPNPASFATSVGNQINDIADGIWGAVQDAWSSFWDGIPGFSWSDVWDSVLNFFQNDSGGSAKGKGGGGGGPVVAAIDTSFLDDAFQSVFDWFGDLPGKISDALPNPFDWIKEKGIAVITGFINGIGQGVLKVAGFVVGLPAAIATWIGDTGSTLLQKGLDIIGGFLGGIATKAVEVANFIISLPGKIVGWIGNTGFTLIGKGVSLIGGFFGGILARINDVANWFFGLKDKIPGWLGNVGSILKAAGEAIMGGLKAGLEKGLDAVGKFLGGVAGFVREHKPIATDHLILHPAGLKIMQGLADGIREGFKGVKDELDTVTEGISGTTFKVNPVAIQKPTAFAAPNVSARDLKALTSINVSGDQRPIVINNTFDQIPTDEDLRRVSATQRRQLESALRAIGK